MQRRPLPPWLQRPRDPCWPVNRKRSYDYHTAIYWATPPWLSKEQRAQMRAIYRNRPPGFHVDHVVPLGDNKNVCGLNVPWNLQYLPDKVNLAKHCKHWPDSPHETHQLFSHVCEPHQLTLV